ncbi:VOC family protein [Pectinatus haikarae]|uniref:Enzyme related to lactoylglutathione lyase n=1 Tax=Pectinatus haikarae TaxID=349096 RepID=A0ABT9YBY4_9FIRM|nr:VOC family protein [Pectinatus haikarae]MDQ0205138.1 putative enzyme related to lactoylglutathione lyase [Pectinatus haikarae]
MAQLRHTGLYVENLDKETEFYKYVFHMYPICEKIEQEDALLIDLLRHVNVSILVTKLITDQGKKTGMGDMLELIQVTAPLQCMVKNNSTMNIYTPGCLHLGFGIDNMEETIDKILLQHGKQYTVVHTMENGNKCCFCKDPEGNWLELIESCNK